MNPFTESTLHRMRKWNLKILEGNEQSRGFGEDAEVYGDLWSVDPGQEVGARREV